jgi:hypothetical protein
MLLHVQVRLSSQALGLISPLNLVLAKAVSITIQVYIGILADEVCIARELTIRTTTLAMHKDCKAQEAQKLQQHKRVLTRPAAARNKRVT